MISLWIARPDDKESPNFLILKPTSSGMERNLVDHSLTQTRALISKKGSK